MSASPTAWEDANQRYLSARVAVVRARVQDHLAGRDGGDEAGLLAAVEHAASELPAASALDTLCRLFALSAFERDVLLLCAAVELDGAFGSALPAPSFGLALAALAQPHWSAIAPQSPLRRWQLVEVAGEGSLTRAPLRIDEKVLHHLTGVDQVDARLDGLVAALPSVGHLTRGQQRCAAEVAALWRAPTAGPSPVIQVCGGDAASRRAVVAAACAACGLRAMVVAAGDLPLQVTDRERLARLWEREAALGGLVLLVEHDAGAVSAFLSSVAGLVVSSSDEPMPMHRRESVVVSLPPATAAELEQVWARALGPLAARCNGSMRRVAQHFPLDPVRIGAAGLEVAARVAAADDPAVDELLWQACRRQSRVQLEGLAQLIEPRATLADLVLPEANKQALRELITHVRQRSRVNDDWGFASRSSRGLGVLALFWGPSGCGKTFAAEAVAQALGLDLVKADLSQVVSKWVGETSKHLRRLFAAGESGAVLLLDECDGLFQRRVSDVRTSNDRYAATEVADLLQRVESYRGVAVLTTNMKDSLDSAFLRRFRFVVEFPFPDRGQRADIWRRVFPAQTPTDGLDFGELARLNCAGGNIYSIALRSAVLAADAGQPVRMSHVLAATRSECQKLERPLTAAEVGVGVTDPRIEVHIDRLVVDGRSPADAHAIAASVRHALEARLLTGGVPPAWRQDVSVGRIETGPPPAADARAIGNHVAAAITGGGGGRR